MTKISETFHGKIVEDLIPLIQETNQFLNITTMKRHGGHISTNARVVKSENGCISFAMYGDFSKSFNHGKQRATEKTLLSLHNSVLEKLEEIKAEAVKQYQNQ